MIILIIRVNSNFWLAPLCKRLTYVAKTRANLTTYSRKPENYNGTIIFEIDTMNNLSPINLSGHVPEIQAEVEVVKIKKFAKKSSLSRIWIDWGRLFHDINLKNIGAIVIL